MGPCRGEARRLVLPVLVSQRGAVEFRFTNAPLWQVAVHQGMKALVVVPLDEVRHLVHEHVLKTR